MTDFIKKINPFSSPKIRFVFTTPERESWIKFVSECRHKIQPSEKNEIIELQFNNEIELKNFYPIHIVLLSCFIDEIKSNGYLVKLIIKNEKLNHYLFDEINLTSYWGKDKVDHVESNKITDLNIWRIIENQKDAYSVNITEYFKRTYFSGYDLSPLKIVLNELYFNIFDHAQAKGNAYSFIKYDNDERRLYVAICDFGLGIASTLRKRYPEFTNDSIALENCVKVGVTSQTQKYNKGFGLDNVASSILMKKDYLRIVSNRSLLRIIDNKENIKAFDLDFNFNGTLVYFEISIDSFVEEEFLDEYSF